MSIGRPRQKLLDWMMDDVHRELKERAQQREEWNHWTFELARELKDPYQHECLIIK
jgi:hypothetical protein